MRSEKPERICLKDGVFLNFLENDRYKTNYINIYFLTPLNDRTASCNTLLARLLPRGCEKYPTQQALGRALDDCYSAQLDAEPLKIGDWHALNIQLSFLDDAFLPAGESIARKARELLREVVFCPYLPSGAFDASYVESEKKAALDELAARINHKARYARERMIEIMCRNEPYRTLSCGKASVLRALSASDLAAYYRALLQTARVEIFFVGRFSSADCVRQMSEFFSETERRYTPLPAQSVIAKAPRVREVTEKMPVSQANLVMGFRTGTTLSDPAWRAMSVYNAVLGGSLTSKLFCVLREKMSLCYSIHSFPDAMKGVLTVAAGIAPENRKVATDEVLRQMDEIKNGHVTAEELIHAKAGLCGAMRGLWDTPAVLSEWYLSGILCDRVRTPSQIVRDIETIDLSQVTEAATCVVPDTFYTLTSSEEARA